jgi:hypothetical protein
MPFGMIPQWQSPDSMQLILSNSDAALYWDYSNSQSYYVLDKTQPHTMSHIPANQLNDWIGSLTLPITVASYKLPQNYSV